MRLITCMLFVPSHAHSHSKRAESRGCQGTGDDPPYHGPAGRLLPLRQEGSSSSLLQVLCSFSLRVLGFGG